MRMTWREIIRGLHEEDSGQDLLEYALVLAAVLAAVVTGSNSIATLIGQSLSSIETKINGLVT
jgi:Flp pilus assembly pilin Flp